MDEEKTTEKNVSKNVSWRRSERPVDVADAIARMEERVAQIAEGSQPELLWMLEHSPIYTAGSSAKDEELIEPDRLPVMRVGRGGRFTYHGPGQRVAYLMLNLRKRQLGVREFVCGLENWVAAAIKRFGVVAEPRHDRRGLWIADEKGSEKKIAAVGVRIRRGVSYYGVAVNVDVDLDVYRGIVPCGIADRGVTSLHALGKNVSMREIDEALLETFDSFFAGA